MGATRATNREKLPVGKREEDQIECGSATQIHNKLFCQRRIMFLLFKVDRKTVGLNIHGHDDC